MTSKILYEFKATVWQHEAPGGWFFVTLPEDVSNEIRENLKWQEEGWGRLKAKAAIHVSEWDTAIWFDSKHKRYLLPLKSEIRKKEKIDLNKEISVKLWI